MNDAQVAYNSVEQASLNLSFEDTTKLSKTLQSLIKKTSYFFLATSSQAGEPNINFKGGEAGFIHIIDDNTILFPDFDGNGIFHGINDMMHNPNVAMLFIDFKNTMRYKANGIATIIDDQDEISQYLDLKGFDYPPRVIKVKITYAIRNCSKNIHLVRDDILEFEQNKDYNKRV